MEQTVAFKDVIKKSMFEMDFTNSLSIGEIIGVLTLTFLMGVFIFFVYRKTFHVPILDIHTWTCPHVTNGLRGTCPVILTPQGWA